jgi:CheY-like chemotaxis protein
MNALAKTTEAARDAVGHAIYQGLNILVVEDDEADAYLIERCLGENPRVATIMRAADGVEALDLIDCGIIEPDLAIVDLHMPRKNGFNLLLELSCRETPRFPMVVLTSSTARTDAIRSKLRGANQVLTKPDTVEELDQVLSEAIAAV